MAAPKGIKAVEWLARRAKAQRGGNDARPDGFDRSAPDALALWRDAYLDQLRARNYAEGTLEGRRDALKVFLAWAGERDLKHAAHITRPILEAYQRALWRSTKANGQRLGWSTQRTRLGVGLGAAPEGALIRFEDGARDVRGVFQVALRRPRQKNCFFDVFSGISSMGCGAYLPRNRAW